MKYKLIISVLAILFTGLCHASSSNDSLPGTWKGTSICQVKPSPCNDEIAAYHITRTGKPNIFHMVLNKVVNGKEEDMGEDDFIFDPADNSLYCYIEKYKVTVKLFVKGDEMEGTLTANDKLYRIIKLKRSE